jgi:hypothetical protein
MHQIRNPKLERPIVQSSIQQNRGNGVRYVTATIGAVVVFFSVLVIAFVIFASLPPKLQSDDWTFHIGIFHMRGNPVLLFAPIVGVTAAFYSFRDSRKRYRINAEEKSRANQVGQP